MQTLGVSYTQGIWWFRVADQKVLFKAEIRQLISHGKPCRLKDEDFSARCLLQTLRRNRHACSHCGCEARAYQVGTRYVQGVPTGKLLTYLEIPVHRLYCPACKASSLLREILESEAWTKNATWPSSAASPATEGKRSILCRSCWAWTSTEIRLSRI